MSKLGCPCGHTISDTTDSLPYKGYLAADKNFFGLLDLAAQDVAAFLKAREAGTERSWLSAYFNEIYPSCPPEEVITDIFGRHVFPGQFDVYQCPNCRRVLIQRSDSPNHFRSFIPEDTPPGDIFE